LACKSWERARGLDGREVLLPSTPKSVSRETTIEGGTIDTEFLGGLIEYLSERHRLNPARIRQAGAHHRLRIRYVDHFSAHQTMRISKPTTTSANCSPPQKTCLPIVHAPRGPSASPASVYTTSKPTNASTNSLTPTPTAAGT